MIVSRDGYVLTNFHVIDSGGSQPQIHGWLGDAPPAGGLPHPDASRTTAMVVGNMINFMATARAWRIFMLHLLFGKRMVWDVPGYTGYGDLIEEATE